MTSAVTTVRGGKVSEDIVVPFDRLGEAIERTQEMGEAVGLPACSWGHAGDGNLHSTFLIRTTDPSELERAEAGGIALFDLAIELGGSLSGEHGLGLVKSGHLERFSAPRKLELHRGIKALFDPRGFSIRARNDERGDRVERRDRIASLLEQAHRRVPPAQGLHQTWHQLAHQARTRLSRRSPHSLP